MTKKGKWKVRRKPYRLELEKSIKQSGFPFQFRVVAALEQLGWEISPSHCIYDETREASCEIDLVAMKRKKYETRKGSFNVNLTLSIECKDSQMPFVSFGLKHQPREMPDFIDEDARYLHLTSTRDRVPGSFRVVALDSDMNPRVPVKASHHR
jgi:hypothetical protein